MNKLEDVDPDALRAALADADDAKTAKRLMIALAYRDGTPVETLSERYGVPKSTIYYWLDRFEERPIPEAIEDEERPGRPSKLDADERDRLARAIGQPPSEYGLGDGEWTPEALQAFIEREFDVAYSLGHVRRLLGDLPESG
jgi:transposase